MQLLLMILLVDELKDSEDMTECLNFKNCMFETHQIFSTCMFKLSSSLQDLSLRQYVGNGVIRLSG